MATTTEVKPDPKVKEPPEGEAQPAKPKAAKPKATPKPKAEKPKAAAKPKEKAIVMGARAGRLLASMNLSKTATAKAMTAATKAVRERDDNRIRIFDIYEATGTEIPKLIVEERDEFLKTGRQRARGEARPKAPAGKGQQREAATSKPPSPDPASSPPPTPSPSAEAEPEQASPTGPEPAPGSDGSRTTSNGKP